MPRFNTYRVQSSHSCHFNKYREPLFLFLFLFLNLNLNLNLHPTMSSILTLQQIPVELQLIIVTHLPFDAVKALSYTNRHFHNLTNPIPFAPSVDDVRAFLVRAERWKLFSWDSHNYLSCSHCLHMLRSSCFGDAQKRNKRYRGGKEAGKRFCLKCGINEYYPRGSTIKVKGVDLLLCYFCRSLESKDDISPVARTCVQCGKVILKRVTGWRRVLCHYRAMWLQNSFLFFVFFLLVCSKGGYYYLTFFGLSRPWLTSWRPFNHLWIRILSSSRTTSRSLLQILFSSYPIINSNSNFKPSNHCTQNTTSPGRENSYVLTFFPPRWTPLAPPNHLWTPFTDNLQIQRHKPRPRLNPQILHLHPSSALVQPLNLGNQTISQFPASTVMTRHLAR